MINELQNQMKVIEQKIEILKKVPNSLSGYDEIQRFVMIDKLNEEYNKLNEHYYNQKRAERIKAENEKK